MKKIALVILVVVAFFSMATAQDVLGAHNGYGRGCVMCHSPHSGSLGNGVSATQAAKDPQNGMYALWGQDLSPLFGAVFNFSGDGKANYPVTLPAAGAITSAHDANTVILFCLSCHDGVLTTVGMMQGTTVETLPIVGGKAPTLLGKAKPSAGGEYTNDHPVGGSAIVGCNVPGKAGYDWDCTGGNTVAISMTGTASAQFLLNNPSSFWNTGTTSGVNVSLATFGTTITAVTCTTCHNQHSMTVYSNNNGSYPTMFFLKGKYTPTAGGNAVAQFCRNCHGGESNEMAGVMGVPTV